MTERFFAITAKAIGSSLYRIDVERNSQGLFPVAEKMAFRGKEGEVKVGDKLGGKYPLLGLGSGLVWYAPHPRWGPGFEDGVMALGARTSPVSAYFLDDVTAFRAFEMEVLVFRDSLWAETSRQTLNAIGDNHPCFYVSHRPSWGFFESAAPEHHHSHTNVKVHDGEPVHGSIFNGGPQY